MNKVFRGGVPPLLDVGAFSWFFMHLALTLLAFYLNIRQSYEHDIHRLCSGRTGNWLQKNRLSLRDNQLKFKTAWNLPIILEEIDRIYPYWLKENRRMSTCNMLDLQTLESQLIMPKNLPITVHSSFEKVQGKWLQTQFGFANHLL